MLLNIKYDVKTGEILAWGERLEAEEGTAILSGIDNDLVQYLQIVDAKVVDGKLHYDPARLEAVRNPQR